MKFHSSARPLPYLALGLALLTGACSSSTKDKPPGPAGGSGGGSGNGDGGGGKGGGAPAGTDDWKLMGYDVQSTFHNTAEKKITVDNVATMTPLWEVVIGSSGTAAVVGSTVYVASGSKIAAVSADDGSPLWDATGDTALMGSTGSPAYDDGYLYFVNGGRDCGTNTDPAAVCPTYVTALDTNNQGAVAWKTAIDTHPATSGYSSVIIVGDLAVVGDSSSEESTTASNATFKGAVAAFDKKTGELKWKTNTAGDSENGCAVWSTVAVDPIAKVVFAGTGNNYTENAGPGSDAIFAFDLTDGHELWRKQVTQGDVFTILNPKSPDTDFGANPVVFDVGDKKFVAGGQKSGDVYVFDRATGDILQHRKLGGGSANIGGIFQGLAFDGTNLLAVNNKTTSTGAGSEPSNGESGTDVSTLFALDPLTLDIVWERQLPANAWGPITVANGVGFAAAETRVQAFNVKDGTKLMEWKVVGTLTGGVAISNGRAYFQSGITYIGGHRDDKFHCLSLP